MLKEMIFYVNVLIILIVKLIVKIVYKDIH